jgi:hypothetical protein
MMVYDGDERLLGVSGLRKCRASKGLSHGNLASQVGRNCGVRSLSDHSAWNGIPSRLIATLPYAVAVQEDFWKQTSL